MSVDMALSQRRGYVRDLDKMSLSMTSRMSRLGNVWACTPFNWAVLITDEDNPDCAQDAFVSLRPSATMNLVWHEIEFPIVSHMETK